jgi:thiosulfate/3-mercaptopyruvate sulfurtransferase
MRYSHEEVLVTPQWLAQNLTNPDLRIVEVDMTPQACSSGHLPNAVFWSIFADLLLPDLSMNLSAEAISQLLSRSGVTPRTTIVAYGSNPATSAWMFWLLRVCGHDRVLVLNGGYTGWIAAGLPVVATISEFPATVYPVASIDDSLRVFLPEVKSAVGSDVREALLWTNRILVDVRTIAEYNGELFMMEPPKENEYAGHIPGAIHAEYSLAFNEDGTFNSAAELSAIYQRLGVNPDQEIFTYCAIGARSASTWFVLKYLLGYPQVRNYDGSWNQWSRQVVSN